MESQDRRSQIAKLILCQVGITVYMKNTVIFGDFKRAVKDFNLTVLSFRQVFFANMNELSAAGQRRAKNAHNNFTILFSENGTGFRLFVSYYIEGIF